MAGIRASCAVNHPSLPRRQKTLIAREERVDRSHGGAPLLQRISFQRGGKGVEAWSSRRLEDAAR